MAQKTNLGWYMKWTHKTLHWRQKPAKLINRTCMKRLPHKSTATTVKHHVKWFLQLSADNPDWINSAHDCRVMISVEMALISFTANNIPARHFTDLMSVINLTSAQHSMRSTQHSFAMHSTPSVCSSFCLLVIT